MKRAILFGIFLALFSVGAWAQSDNQQNASSSTGSSNAVTVRGCLTGSAGTYVLVADQQGKPYMLRGSNTDLDKMILHEVEISGQLVNQTGTDRSQTASGEASNRTQPPGATLQVSSVREISDTCSAKSAR